MARYPKVERGKGKGEELRRLVLYTGLALVTQGPEQNLPLSNQEFTTYCCFRLGRVPHEGAPCPVCRNANLDENGYHQVSGCVKGQQNELLDEVARHAVRAGLQVFKDCSITLSNSRQRPGDLAIRRFANGKDASVVVMLRVEFG